MAHSAEFWRGYIRARAEARTTEESDYLLDLRAEQSRAESRAYAAWKQCFWRAMKPQPDDVVCGFPYWHVGGYRLWHGATNPLPCPYGTPGDHILVATSKELSHLHHITAITVEQRGGRWGWVVEVGA